MKEIFILAMKRLSLWLYGESKEKLDAEVAEQERRIRERRGEREQAEREARRKFLRLRMDLQQRKGR